MEPWAATLHTRRKTSPCLVGDGSGLPVPRGGQIRHPSSTQHRRIIDPMETHPQEGPSPAVTAAQPTDPGIWIWAHLADEALNDGGLAAQTHYRPAQLATQRGFVVTAQISQPAAEPPREAA